MDRRLAAAQIVVIHGRQIVMDQRITVQAFECRTDAQCRLAFSAEQGGTFDDEEGSQPLAAVQRSMAHRSGQVFRPGDLVFQRLR
ncbi:hypothetical protein D3C80_391240 [compost metagenome]